MDGSPKVPRACVSGQKVSEPGFMVQDSLGFIISSVNPKYEECIVSFNLGPVGSLYSWKQ